MKEPFTWKVQLAIHRFICRLTGHDYGCCQKLFKCCSRCKYNQ